MKKKEKKRKEERRKRKNRRRGHVGMMNSRSRVFFLFFFLSWPEADPPPASILIDHLTSRMQSYNRFQTPNRLVFTRNARHFPFRLFFIFLSPPIGLFNQRPLVSAMKSSSLSRLHCVIESTGEHVICISSTGFNVCLVQKFVFLFFFFFFKNHKFLFRNGKERGFV